MAIKKRRMQKKRSPSQLSLLPKMSLAYGGDLLKKRRARSGGRPISTKETMHLVLRSTCAKGSWSFKTAKNEALISDIMKKFSKIHFVQVLSVANVGNHLHLQIKLGKMHSYKKFIRAVTSAIAMKIANLSRWQTKEQVGLKQFWDRRPFSRIIRSYRAILTLRDYIQINRLQGEGYCKNEARYLVKYVSSA